MGKMKELSVIIVTYNSEPDIYGCLEALFAHNDICDALEVIVVDNNSRDFQQMKEEITRLYGETVTVLVILKMAVTGRETTSASGMPLRL